MKVALLANSASSLWPCTDCRAKLIHRLDRRTGHVHDGACCLCRGRIRESKTSLYWHFGLCDCAPPVGSPPTGGAQWVKNVNICLRTLSLDFFSQCEGLRGDGGLQAAAALPQFALVAVQCHLLQGGGSGRCRLHLGLRSRCAPWGETAIPVRGSQLHRFHGFSKK